MKRFIAIASILTCCMSNAVPASAGITNDQIKESNRILSQSLKHLRAGNSKAACSSYKAHVAYMQRHNGFDYVPVNGTGELRETQIKINKIRKESNESLNPTGSRICNKAGENWTNIVLPTPPATNSYSSNVSNNIRNHCEREWGTNYRMIKYCVDQQTKAANALGY